MLKIAYYLLVIGSLTACRGANSSQQTHVQIDTSLGTMKIRLYDETPLHRDNFIRLVQEGYYNEQLFHRVIREFMVQAGDPESINASPNRLLGTRDVGYTLPAEIRYPHYFNKRGALTAAREGNERNLEMSSSGSQFFLVWGKTYTDAELNEIIRKRNEQEIGQIVNQLIAQYAEGFRIIEERDDLTLLQHYMDSLRQIGIRLSTPFVLPPEVREYYKSVGGAPWLDQQYTVFGELTEGFDVLERMQGAKTNTQDRPIHDIKIKMKIVKQ